MKRYLCGVLTVLAVVIVSGCAGGRIPKVTAGGQKIEVSVYCYRGNPAEMNKKQYKMRQDMAGWMERDLVNQLRRHGYVATLITDKAAFTPADNKYLLAVSIVSYNPGSAAARSFVGFGAGAAALNNTYEFKGGKGVSVNWKDGAGTSQHWSRIPRKLNGNAVRKVNTTLFPGQ